MKVGLLHPRTGIAGMWAPSMDAAALVAAAEINAAGGILGQEIELVFGDCGFSNGEALAAVNTLLEVDGAEAIIGGHPSNIRDTISDRVSHRVPYIYTPQYEGIACGPSTIAIGSVDHELMAPALHWFRNDKRAEHFFFVGNDYIWPRSALATTRQLMLQQGGKLVGDLLVPTHPIDYTAVLRQIARSGAQVVIQALVGQCSVEFNRAFAAAGLDEKMLRFGLIVDETVICGIGADASSNLFTAANYFSEHHSQSNDHFLELYHDAFGEYAPPVSAASVGCYEGFHVLAGLARDLQSRDSRRLAHHLKRSLTRPAARHMLSGKPVGRSPGVYLGQAEGATLRVVAALAH